MSMAEHKQTVDLGSNSFQPLRGAPSDYDSLLQLVGDVHFVLIGEASHGTHEFYIHRAEISKRLVREQHSEAHLEEVPETFPSEV